MSNPTLLNIPAASKEGKIYSIIPDNGNGDFTTTRGCTRTRINSVREVESVTDHNRIKPDYSQSGCPKNLFEPTRTNLLPYSNTSDFTIVGGTRGLTETKQGIDGYNYQADVIAKTITDNTIGYKTNSFYVDISQSTTYELSLEADASGQGASVIFTSATKTFGTITENPTFCQNSVVKATQLNGDIYRLELTTEIINVTTALIIEVSFDNGVDVWLGGAQLEQGYGSTSLIPTNGSQLIRFYDKATSGGLITNGILSATEGSIYLEFDSEAVVRDSSASWLDIGVANGYFRIKSVASAFPDFSYVQIQVTDGSIYFYQLMARYTKIIFNYNSGGVDLWVNGSKVLNIAKSFSLTNEILQLSGQTIKCAIGNIALYNTQQTDGFCQQLTTI